MPVRLFSYAAVGGIGLLVHMALLALAFEAFDMPFVLAQALATLVAMAFNFFLNNHVTFHDRRLNGARSLMLGLLSFFALCSFGALASVSVAWLAYAGGAPWWLAGLIGTAVSAAWNYTATSLVTWRTVKR